MTEAVPARAPERRASLTGWPVNLLVAGRKVVVVGAGRIAARKTAPLVELGAVVTVVAPTISDEMRALNVALVERAFEPADLDDAWFVVTATDVPAVNTAVFEAAEARRMFCNSADDPTNCSATLMALVRQGDLVVAIGSGGRSPALATWLRQHVRSEMGPEYLTLVELLSEEPTGPHHLRRPAPAYRSPIASARPWPSRPPWLPSGSPQT